MMARWFVVAVLLSGCGGVAVDTTEETYELDAAEDGGAAPAPDAGCVDTPEQRCKRLRDRR